MTTTREIPVYPAKIWSNNSRKLRYAVLGYKAWRQAELCDSTFGTVAPTQGVYLEVQIDDPARDTLAGNGEFVVLLTQDTVNGGLEVLLAYENTYVLAAYTPHQDQLSIKRSLVYKKNVDQRDDDALFEIYLALRSA